MEKRISAFENFTEQVKEALTGRYPQGEVTLRKVTKNNDVVLTGVMISEDEGHIHPTLYLEKFFTESEGEVTEELIDKICRVYESSKLKKNVTLDYLRNYEELKSGLRCKLMNLEMNREYLKDVPYRQFMDLAIVPYYRFEKKALNSIIDGSATFTVRYPQLDMWGVDGETVLDEAIRNTKDSEQPVIVGIYDALKKLNPAFAVPQGEEDVCPMWIMRTDSFNGSIAMIYQDKIKEFCEKIGNDVYIIPSSINETILVPVNDDLPVEVINSMIREVNCTEISAEEVLSDHVYYFDRNTGYRKEAVA